MFDIFGVYLKHTMFDHV